jgi:hypothetical protein
MATKKIRLPIAIGVIDEARSKPERLTPEGRVLSDAVTFHKIIPAGEPVTLDAEEADALLAKFGPYKQTVIVTEGEVPGVVAPPAPPVASARR